MTDLVIRCRDCNLRFLTIEEWQEHWPICPCRWDAEKDEQSQREPNNPEQRRLPEEH